MTRSLVLAIATLLLLQGAAWAQDQPAPAPEPPTAAPPPPPPAPPPAPPPPAPPPAPRAVDTETPGRAAAPPAAPAAAPDGSPVVRAQAGNLGFFFKLGGLATLDHSNTSRTVDGLAFTQIGMKFVSSERLMLRAYFGTGLQHSKAEACPATGTCSSSKSTDMGIEAGVTLEYHFRVWRRISPFVGAGLGLGYINPSGAENWNVGVGFGPLVGVEYYLGDRLSVTAEYMLTFEVGYQKVPTGSGAGATASVTTFAYRTLAGGALVITYYF
jgi:opacity protein-like surface antigen